MAVDPTAFSQILEGAVSAKTRRRVIAAMMKAAAPGGLRSIRDVKAIAPNLNIASVMERTATWAEARFPDLVAGLNQESMAKLQTIVQKGLNEGLGSHGLADRIEDQFTDWRTSGKRRVRIDGRMVTVDTQSRAEMVARTETGDAFNEGTLDGYDAAGVGKVLVSDGTDDPECAEANGSTWTIDDARLKRLEHPNCTRGFSAVLP